MTGRSRLTAGVTAMLAAIVLLAVPASAGPGRDFQIVNGRSADPGEWPSFTFVSADTGGADGVLQCGATLIAPDWVLTAAHCVYDVRTEAAIAPSRIFTLVGAYDLSIPDGEQRAVDAVVVHPAYDPLVPVNDLALLHLAVPTGAPLQRLVARGEEALYPPGTQAVGIGLGAITPSGDTFPNILQEGDLPIEGDATCQSQGFPNLDPARHLCAGTRGPSSAQPGNSACFGDSGGPLLVPDTVGDFVQVGLVSFGPTECGVQRPGVFTEIAQYRTWIDGTIAGTIAVGSQDPDNVRDTGGGPVGTLPEPVRVSDGAPLSAPVQQAVLDSFLAFEDQTALWGVLARGDLYADALGGSSLAFGFGPLLFTNPDGTVAPEVLSEFRRTVPAGARIYVLGGAAAIPLSADQALAAAGFQVVRLAGSGREQTAGFVARETIANFASLTDTSPQVAPFDTVIVATAANWPDAVAAGQIGSWFGIPIVLTGPATLGDAARDIVTSYNRPDLNQGVPLQVVVVGGEAVVGPGVAAELGRIVGGANVTRLGGATRTGTAAAVLEFTLFLHQVIENSPPDLAVTVNLRRGDAFAHVLSASMLTGRFSGVFVTAEGETGELLPSEVIQSACNIRLRQVVQGGPDLVVEPTVQQVQRTLAGEGCVPLAGANPATLAASRTASTIASAAPSGWSALR